MDEQDRQRRRALIAFQVFIYGFLGLMIVIQLYMYSTHNW